MDIGSLFKLAPGQKGLHITFGAHQNEVYPCENIFCEIVLVTKSAGCTI